MSKNIRYAQIYMNTKYEWWLQISLVYSLSTVATGWQDCTTLGNYCLTPKVDIQYSLTRCLDEADAMLQLATHYANELKINQSIKPV